MARLKSSIWVQAHIRRCQSEGAFAVIVRKGDIDAGAIAIKIYGGRNQARLILKSLDLDGNPIWRDAFPLSEAENIFTPEEQVDERLQREINMDPDLWVIEIENCDGNGYLDISV